MPLTLNATGVVAVDDTSPSIDYQGTWQTGGVKEEYDFTTHGTSQPGALATFLFNGTSVAVYGTLGPEGTPTTTYNLDDSSLIQFQAPAVQLSVHQTLFYQSPALQDGSHRLVITNINNSGVFWLDYLLYIPSPSPSTSVIQSSTSTTPNASPTNSTSPSTNINVGALAGGIVGGLAFAGVIVVLLLFWRRRSYKKRTLEEHPNPSFQVNPFVVPVPETRHLHDHQAQPLLGGSPYSTSRLYSKSPPVHTRLHHSIDQSSSSGNRSQPDTGEATTVGFEPSPNTVNDSVHSSTGGNVRSTNIYIGPEGGQSDIRLHQDGGTRIAGGPPDAPQPFSPSVDIPPAYNRF